MGRIHNIEGKKNKMDSLRSTTFTKHARNITVAARQGGGDPAYNAALKLAIDKAKADNMPNDNINRAIKKGIGATDGEKYEHITYEGYGPGGVALIIECLTDNKNRTAGNVRHHLDRCGGNLGTACDLSRSNACHRGHDEGGGQTAGYLAAGVCDGVAVGDEVITQGVDAPGVHGHVGH